MRKSRVFSFILMVFMLLGILSLPTVFSAEEDLPFRDVKENKWFYGAVKSVYEAGIMNGITEDSFRPNDPMTRGQFVTIIARVSGEDVSGMAAEAKFADTAKKRFYSDALGWCVKNGLINGYPDNTFGPDRPILRQEFAAVFVRYLDYKKLTINGEDTAGKFGDESKFPKYAKEAIETLRLTGLVKGDKTGNFNPKNDMTRAEIAQVIARLLPYVQGVEMVKNGNTDYVVVCAAGAEQAAERLQWQVKTLTGADVPVVNDETAPADHEIVLGETNRGGGIDPAGLGEDGYEIKIDGVKYFVGGETPEGIYRGVTALLKSGRANGNSFYLPEDADSRVPFEYPIGKLTVNGRDISEYVIVYPEDASPSVMTGVNDLVKYIEKACGARLETTNERKSPAIVVDQTPVEIEDSYNFNRENYSIKSSGDDVIIRGAPEAGAMYGCYAFLKYQLGWYFLTPEIDYIRPCGTLELRDIDVTFKPYFEYRINYWYSPLQYGDYAAKTEQNGSGKVNNAPEYGIYVGCDGNGVHNLPNLYFGYYTDGPQPCLNDDETYETVLRNVIKEVEKYGPETVIDISHADGGQICQCDKCRAVREEEGSEAGNMVRFINRIIDGLTEAGYDRVSIHTIAYMSTLKACKTKPDPRVIVQYCTLDTCLTDPIDDCVTTNHGDNISEWGNVCNRIWVWDYGFHFFNYLNISANEKYEVLCHNIRFYYEHGVSGLFNQGLSYAPRNGEFSEMKQFLLTEIMHNPYLTREEYYDRMDAFIEGYYGVDCVDAIRDFEGVKTLYNRCDLWCYDDRDEIFTKCLFFRKHFGRAAGDFTEASLLTDTYTGWDNVNVDRMQIDYLIASDDFFTAKRTKNGELLRKAQLETFALLEKMRAYGFRLDDNRQLPKFSSPDEITESPGLWRFIIRNDGSLISEAE